MANMYFSPSQNPVRRPGVILGTLLVAVGTFASTVGLLQMAVGTILYTTQAVPQVTAIAAHPNPMQMARSSRSMFIAPASTAQEKESLQSPQTVKQNSFYMAAVLPISVAFLMKGFIELKRKLRSGEQAHILGQTMATAVTVATMGNAFVVDPAEAFQIPISEKQLYTDAWKAVGDSFIDKSFNGQDWNKVKEESLKKPLASRQETYATIRESLDLLGDPFTRLLDPPQYDNIKRRLTGRLSGVGMEIVPFTQDGVKTMKVVDRTLDGPADKAGIKDDDLILAVNGEAIGESNQWELADKIVGDKKSQVVLTVQTRGEDPRELTLVRDNVVFQAVKYAVCEGVANQEYKEKPIEKLGYVRVPSFNYSTAAEFNKALKELTKGGADGIVIDLRSDTGGSLNAAYEMANSILPKGEIVRVVGSDGVITSAQVRGRALYPDVPISLLVDDHTASSSEVLGAALKAAGRAEIAGEQTFGKGIIQDIRVLADGSAIFVTKERYLTPLNEEIDKVGITPTVAVRKDLLNTKTGLRVEPTQFCADMSREAPPLFSGQAPPPAGEHPDLDLNSLSAFC